MSRRTRRIYAEEGMRYFLYSLIRRSAVHGACAAALLAGLSVYLIWPVITSGDPKRWPSPMARRSCAG
jgi:hypothetical protein